MRTSVVHRRTNSNAYIINLICILFACCFGFVLGKLYSIHCQTYYF